MSEVQSRLTLALSDRYRIERELGRGGMATVFLAEDSKHHRRVAIKVLDPDLAAAIGTERFLREIETAARLTHPHILPLHDSGVADGLLYYVMPYVEGESLRARLRRERQLPVEDALRIAREVADALGCAHAHGVIHRDIKPENVLLEEGHAIVADFGIARVATQHPAGTQATTDAAWSRTTTGIRVGTPGYMSPEQLTGRGELDGRSDLYSLGCMLYEMLAGQPPFAGPTPESVANQHAYATPRPVSALRPEVPAGVVVVLQRALAKSPADRFETAAGFGEALRRSEVAMAPRGRRTWGLAAGAAFVLALGSAAVWQGWGPFANWPGETAAPPPKQHWILVAEFEGPPDDSTLAPAARSLVSAALDQSGFLATVPGEQISLALQLAGKAANTRVSAEVAHELAYRRSVRAVLEGDVARIGQGYSVVLRVVDAESLRVVLTERTSARNADALIPAIGRLAERLRRDLGERQDAIAGTRAMADVATPSFEAYRLYVQASRIGQSGDYQGSIAVGREALRLDPDFAMVWSMIGVMYLNLGQADSAVAALDEALRRPQRLTTIQRLLIDAHRARAEGDPERAVEYYSRRLQLSPNSPVALNSLANTLTDVGRFEEALARYEEGERHSPFGAGPMVVGNRIICLLSLGRVEQARELARPLPGVFGIIRRTEVELAACNWAMAESMATAQAVDPSASTLRQMSAAFRLAQAQAGRGSLEAARATLLRSIQLAQGSPLMQVSAGRVLLHLAVESRGAIAVPDDMLQADNSAAAVLFRGLRAAVMGNEAAARRGLEQVRRRAGLEVAAQKGALLLLEAKLAALSGRRDEVVRMLQPVASQSADLIPAYAADYSVGLPIARCILADAFEKLGAPDSAAAYLERMTTDPNAGLDWPGAVQPLAHWRLSLLYSRTGRAADAERHLAVLERWWDRPDDVARRMLDEARGAGCGGCSGTRLAHRPQHHPPRSPLSPRHTPPPPSPPPRPGTGRASRRNGQPPGGARRAARTRNRWPR